MTHTNLKKHLIKVLPDKRAFFCHEEQTLLDAALDAGLALPHSCRGGNCGSCTAQRHTGAYVYRSAVIPAGISQAQVQGGAVLLCQIQPRSAMTIEVTTARSAVSAAVVKLPCRIVGKEQLATDVVKLLIQLPRSQPLQFSPGQYVDFILPSGRRRSYSLACLPSLTEPLELHVRRVAGGEFSALAFDNSTRGNLLKLEGPFGNFGWRDSAHDVVMIAGGTGYAPLKAMLLDAWCREDRASYDGTHADEIASRQRTVHLFWGGRDVQDLYELDTLRQWAAQRKNFTFTPVIASAAADAADIAVGNVHDIARRYYADFAGKEIYASGPPAMIATLKQDFLAAGVTAELLHCDAFDYAP